MKSLTTRRWLGHLGALVLGGVLLVAVAGKVLHPAAFAAQIRAEVPGAWVPARALAVLVLGLEAGIGVALWLGVRHRGLLAVTTGMVTLFLFLTGRSYLRFLQGTLPEDSGCGCFGYLIERTPAEAFWGDLALLAVPLVLLWVAARTAPPELPRRRLGLAALAAALVMVLAFEAPSLPVDDWATRLAPGTQVEALCAGHEPRVCLTEVAPELAEGTHWVILSDLDEALAARVPRLNQALWDAGDAWGLLVLTRGTSGEADMFGFRTGPAFGVHAEVPGALMAPLYRTLPRSFEVVEGRVVKTVAGWPPWLEGEP